MAVKERGGRVLIADDQADIRLLLATRLGLDPEIEVVGEAANGAEAISKVGELNPAALILDLQMPVMSGEEAIPILRWLAPELRIVVFSAFVSVDEDLCGSERPDAAVAKGGDLGVLVREVHRLLEDPPADVVEVELGWIGHAEGAEALENWAMLRLQLKMAAPEGRESPDLLALAGVFLIAGRQLGQAHARGEAGCRLRFRSRLAAARGARRALAALEPETAIQLEPLSSRLLARLPE